jgi:ABC-type transport system involved in multi-copper enzyme maturation permease subunit
MIRRAGRHVGVGPVFVYEWLTSTRRWQAYALRAGFLLMLLCTLVVIWNANRPPDAASPARLMALLGEWFFIGVVGMQLTLVLLAAPAATAGAICLDRARGALTHMLVTDLSSAEIVLGKLAARLVPVLVLVAATLPMMEILALVGGLDPNALVGAFVVTVGVAVLGCGLALLLSLWVGKTSEALLGTYAVWGLWLLWRPIFAVIRFLLPGAFLPPPRWSDPYRLAFAAYWAPRQVAWEDYAWFLGVSSGIGLLCALVAVLSLRAIVTREAVRNTARSLFDRVCDRLAPRQYLPRRLLDWNPVYWREWHRSRPSRWARAVNALYFAIASFFSLTTVALQSGMVAPWVNALQIFTGLLMLSVTASASLAEERARGSLDLLMTTMLSTRQIVLGKWLGAYRAVPLLAVLPALVVFGFVNDRPDRWKHALLLIVYVLTAGAAITSLGLAMATWVPRVGRAVAATVSIYVAIAVGWLFAVEMVVHRPSLTADGLMMVSPFVWALMVTLRGTETGIAPQVIEVWAVIWIVILLASAAALFLAALMSFDRQLGRLEGPVLRLLHGDFTHRQRLLGLSCVAGAFIAAAVAMLSAPDSLLGFLLNGALVSIGVLLAALAAAISCGPALSPGGRARAFYAGQSPLRIVMARWLGAGRLVGLVAILASVAVLGRWDTGTYTLLRSWLIPTYVVVVGAAWCGLGVALGMSLARRSAVMLTTAIYGLVFAFGMLVGAYFLDSAPGRVAWLSSPFVGVSTMTIEMNARSSSGFDPFGPLLATIAIHAAATVALLAAATVALGRSVLRPSGRIGHDSMNHGLSPNHIHPF